MKTLGSRIKYIRGTETQEAFAAKLGVSKGALGGYERDENSPSADAVLKICSGADISVEWLMLGTGEMRKRGHPEGEETTISKTESVAKVTCSRCAHLEQRLEVTSDKLVETLQANVALATELGQQKLENLKLTQQLETARQMCREYANTAKNVDAQNALFDERQIIPSSDANHVR